MYEGGGGGAEGGTVNGPEEQDPKFLTRAAYGQCISRCMRGSRNLSSLRANSLRLLSVPEPRRSCTPNAVARPNDSCSTGWKPPVKDQVTARFGGVAPTRVACAGPGDVA